MAEAKTRGAFPPPREGLVGEWDELVDPRAARWENAGTIGCAALHVYPVLAPLGG